MTTITCKRCGHSFETEATTNTRCRSCRDVVRVPAAARNPNGSGRTGSTREHTLGIVPLGCGHPAVVVVHPGRSLAATLKRYEWECPDTPAPPSRRCRCWQCSREVEYENLGQEAFDMLVSRGVAS
jgi:DNA-directed RNA polymerase subunit RPC12/RpoP